MKPLNLYFVKLIMISLLLGYTVTSSAQPPVEFLRNYHAGGDETFHDIYAVSDSSFIMCGYSADSMDNFSSYVLRADRNGEAIWSRTYGDITIANSIIETDDGNFLIGGSGNGQFYAMLIDGEGDIIWRCDYDEGRCLAVIELKNGDFLLGGRGSDGRLILINEDGDPLWDNNYAPGGSEAINALRETDGGAVATGYARNPSHFWALKVDLEEGETIWSNNFNEVGGGRGYSMVSSADGGFALSGWKTGVPTGFLLLKIDDEGEEQFHHNYQRDYGAEDNYCLVGLDDGGYALVGTAGVRNGRYAPLAIRTTPQGEVRWRQIYNLSEDERFTGTSWFFSVTKAYDGSIVAAGWATRSEEDQFGDDGIIIKLAPEILNPIVMYHSPEDTMLSVLSGDTTQFIVVAEIPLNDSLGYEWFFGDSSLGGDTTVTMEWDELGDYIVQCRVSSFEFTTAITWHVNVTDFYIDSYSPPILNLPIRRNGSIDFSVSTRATADDPVEYVWLLDDEQIADDDSVSIRFERGREHSVTAVASQGELSDSVTWRVMVNDLIVDYMPAQFDLSVPVDTTFEFELFPFDPNDDSLRFTWTVNGDSISNRSWLLMNFDEQGVYSITVYVSDTTESDSLTWEVNVQPNSIHTDAPRHPDTPTLQAPTPNPFNSRTRIGYSLPIEAQIDLGLYDISGRRVVTLYSGVRAAGVWSATLDGSDLSSGIYFVGMSIGEQRLLQKVVLVK